MKIHRRLLLGAAMAAALVGVSVPAQAETTIRLLSGWPQNTSMIRSGETKYIANVEAASNGAVKIVRNGPEAVPPFQQFQPLSAGVFDLLYTTPSYHQADTGIGAALDGLLTPDTARLREAGVIDWLNDYYRENFGVIILALIPTPSNHLVLREPLNPDGRLEGLKIRTNAAFEGIVRGLGAAPVGLPPNEIYSGLQKGVIDGTAGPQMASADYKLHEVSSYMTRPGFGHATNVLMANADAFDALPEDVRTLLQEEAIRLESSAAEEMIAVAAEQNAIMEANGVQIVEFPPEVAEKLPQLFVEGTTEVARRSDPANVDALIEFARSKDMLAR